MNTDNFIKTLNELDNYSYIAVNRGDRNYRITFGKHNKNINTHEMAVLANRCFDQINASKVTYDKKENDFSLLASGLEKYTSRLFASKTWYQKIASFFGFKNYAEKEIDTVKKLSKEKANESQTRVDRVLQSLEVLKNYIQQQETDPLTQLKHYYLGVIDSSSIRVPILEGTQQSSAILWYINHLKNFYNQMGNKYSNEDKIRIQNLISQYEFTLKISLAYTKIRTSKLLETQLKDNPGALYFLQDSFLSRCLEKISDKPINQLPYVKDVITQLIQKKLAELPVGGRIVLPGGYSSEPNAKEENAKEATGHGVLYSIEKTYADHFTFKVINTGEGAKLSQPIRDLAKNGFKILKSVFTGKDEVMRFNIKDCQYNNIPLKALNDSFFGGLIEHEVGGKTKSMEEIYKSLNELFSQYGHVKEGRKHKTQSKGSCAHKCVSADAHDYLSDNDILYRRLKVFITEQENDKLNRMDLGQLKIEDNLIQSFANDGQRLLKHRRKKALIN